MAYFKKKVGVIQTVVNAECETVGKRMRFFDQPRPMGVYPDPVAKANEATGWKRDAFFKEGSGTDLWCVVESREPNRDNGFFWMAIFSLLVNAIVIAGLERFSVLWCFIAGLTVSTLVMTARVFWLGRHWKDRP